MTHLRNISAVVAIAGLAFLLGWSMRGDAIYSGMFNNSVAMMPKV